MTRHVHAVGVLFEDKAGEVLVLRRHKNSPEAKVWGLVGGNIDPGEDKLTAAVRESEEEIGHSIPHEKLQFVRTYSWEREDVTITFEVYRYRVSKQEVDIILDTEEATDFIWATPQRLYEKEDLMIGLYPIFKDLYSL